MVVRRVSRVGTGLTNGCVRLRRCAAIFLALFSLSASPARAQSTTQRRDPQRTGSARITGQVLASDYGRPVRRAVRLSGGSAAGTQSSDPKRAYLQREIQTDDDGGFNFVGPPAGSYYISVGRTNGFVELARAKQVTVDEGRSAEVPIRLERTGAIVGVSRTAMARACRAWRSWLYTETSSVGVSL